MSNQQTVIMVPAKAKRQDLITDTNVIVYMPLATTKNPGVVKIGEGLNIDADGVLTFDKNEVTILQIAKNGEIIHPDENKIVNIQLNKNDVGLGNVDNTADINKPVSIYQQEALDTKLNKHVGVGNANKMLYVDNSGNINYKILHKLEIKKNNSSVNSDVLSLNFSNLFDVTSVANEVSINAGSNIRNAFNSVTYTSSTGVLRFTKVDGTTVDVDLPLELLIQSGYYDDDTKEIVLVLANGDEIRIPAEGLVDSYKADEITTTMVDNIFSVKDGGITTNKIANYTITDDKIVSLSGSKIIGVVDNAYHAEMAIKDENGNNISTTYRKITDSYNKTEIENFLMEKANVSQLPTVIRLVEV